MNSYHVADRPLRPVIRLSYMLEHIRLNKLISPIPSRQTLIKLCVTGDLETSGRGKPSRFGYLVYRDSFEEWLLTHC